MPRQNRVLPTGEIVALRDRGLFTGNRGCLHDDEGRLGRARWRHPHWITCALEWKGIRRELMAPGRWTELFFLDEAVALAAGHRPCAYCRREAYNGWVAAWQAAGLPGRWAKEMDAELHVARVGEGGAQRHFIDDNPPLGAFVLMDRPHLVVPGGLRAFAPSGYGPLIPRPAGSLTVMTPAPTVAVLRAGYAPILHPSAA